MDQVGHASRRYAGRHQRIEGADIRAARRGSNLDDADLALVHRDQIREGAADLDANPHALLSSLNGRYPIPPVGLCNQSEI